MRVFVLQEKTAVTFCSAETKRPLLFVLQKQNDRYFLFCRNKTAVTFFLQKQNGRYFLFCRNKTTVTHNRCEGEYLSLRARKWQVMEKIPSKKLHNFCKSLNIISANRWAAHVARGIDMQDMQGDKLQKIDTKFFVDILEWARIF